MPRFISGPSGPLTAPHPYGRITNRIIMRGMGPHINRLICQGYGGPPRFVQLAIQRGIWVGQSGFKRRQRELQTIIVWAKLLEVNGKIVPNKVAPKKIEGFVRVHVSRDRGFAAVMAEHVSSRVKKAWEDFKVIVKRIK